MRGAEKIAIVVGSMRVGGTQRVALNLAREFANRGYDVDVVVVSPKGALLQQVPQNARLVSLGSASARASVFKLRRYLHGVRPSSILSIAFHVNVLSAIATIGLRPRPRLILSVHSTFSQMLRESTLRARVWLSIATPILYRLADQVVAVSSGAARDLTRWTGIDSARITTIHNPVLREDFNLLATGPVTHPWAANKTQPLVVAVGRLTQAKGYPLLVRAFAEVLKTTQARLLIVGEGETRREIEQLIVRNGLSDAVALVGNVENPLPYMRAADVFALSSVREGFGNVLVEAMSVGTPVISTDCPHGPREILEDGRWGRLVPVGDPTALAEAIIDVLRNGGVDGRPRAGDFSVKAAADSYLALIST